MIVTYTGNDSSPFVKGDDYFCFEIYINKIRNTVSYRMVNVYGEIAIYGSGLFVVKDGQLKNMIFNKVDYGFVLRLEDIQKLDDSCNDVNGLWGAYHDGDRLIEEKVHEVIAKQAELEGFQLVELVAL